MKFIRNDLDPTWACDFVVVVKAPLCVLRVFIVFVAGPTLLGARRGD